MKSAALSMKKKDTGTLRVSNCRGVQGASNECLHGALGEKIRENEHKERAKWEKQACEQEVTRCRSMTQ